MNDKSPLIGLTTFGVIFLACILIVIFQHFLRESFGIIGILAWLVVLVGVASFIYHSLDQ